MLHIKSAKYISDFKLMITFDDGYMGEVDLEKHLEGPVFEPLKEKKAFAIFTVDPELGTIVWSNGADLAPEFLKELSLKQLATSVTD